MSTTDGPADWGTLVSGAVRHYDKDEVKAGLPLEWVLMRHGIHMEPQQDGRLVGPCPFHDDSDPSFAIFGEGHLQAGCWVCDFKQGDVFDVLARFHSLDDFKSALSKAGEMLSEFRLDSAWRPRAGEVAAKPKADPRDLTRAAAEAWQFAAQEQTALWRLIDEKQQQGNPGWARVTPDFLHRSWFVGAEDDWTVLVPHYSDRGDGLLARAIKTRTPRSHLYARSGSDLADLYGLWRLAGKDAVLVVEGESDAWTSSAALGDRMDVLAVPSGAGTPPPDHWLAVLDRKHVVLAFDGDLAGRGAARRWHRALVGRGKAKSVRVAAMPDGHDLSSCPDLVAVVDAATEVLPVVGNVFEQGGVYVRRGKEEDTKVSNWSLSADRELAFEDGTKAYEGRVLGKAVVLRSQDCETDGSITRFSASVGGNWLGVKRDAQSLLGLLESEGPFLARGRATTVAGWHEGNFVWPGGRMGPEYWRYVPPASEVQMEHLRIQDGPWDQALVEALLTLHQPAVTCPVLAWLAASPLRSMFRTFPFLAVTGTSGSGKTTLTEAVLDAFGWRVGTTLTATTPHAVHSFAGATNGIPVWFDEYRPGAREDSLMTMNQVLRDAYDGTPSYKGGAKDNKMALTAMPTSSPILVTGEDAFSETSHVERMVLVNLPVDGRNPGALRALRRMERTGFGHAYLSWLVGAYWRGELPSVEVDATEGRIASNMRLLGVGWSLLEAFHGATTGRGLPDPDWSLVERGIAEAAATDPITDALSWAMHATNLRAGLVVWAEGQDVIVRVEDFVREAQMTGQFTLPGNRTAIARYLDEKWGAERLSHPAHGRVRRLPNAASRLR